MNERHWSAKPSAQLMIVLVCWLEIDHHLVTLSCLPCALFCSCPCKVRSRVSDALSQALYNLSLAFLTDFTLSDSTAPIHFIVKLFSLANFTLLFVWIERQDHSVCMSSILQIQQLYTDCRHTFVGGILTANGQQAIIELAKNVSPKNKMAARHVSAYYIIHVQIHAHARFPRSKKWPTYHVAVPTGNALASQRSVFRENRLKFSTFIRRWEG